MTDLIKRNSVDEMVAIYNKAVEDVTAGYALLHAAKTSMQAHIYQYAEVLTENHRYADFDEQSLASVIKGLKRATWRGISEKLNIRATMSTKQQNIFDEQLKTGEGLPEINTDAIMQVIESLINNIGTYATEAVKEAFEIITRYSKDFKSTDGFFRIGEKFVLSYCVNYSWQKWRTTYGRAEDQLRIIENAFRMMDGKGPGTKYVSELSEAIQSTTGDTGETEYFRFRCFKNSNLHVWVKRPDLLAELNNIGAGGAMTLNKAS